MALGTEYSVWHVQFSTAQADYLDKCPELLLQAPSCLFRITTRGFQR